MRKCIMQYGMGEGVGVIEGVMLLDCDGEKDFEADEERECDRDCEGESDLEGLRVRDWEAEKLAVTEGVMD